MRRYWAAAATLIGFFLALFGLVEALHVPLLTDPAGWLGNGGPLAAALGVALLIADVFLPVPSSVVMIAHGALFGVVVGSTLSVVGSLGAALLGFAVGRRGSATLSRLVSPAQKARADRLLERWGVLAVVVTRPIPLLAETTAIMAGASPMRWAQMLLASLAGSLPPALLYAVTGATSRDMSSGVVMFALVVALAGVVWLIGKRGDPVE